MLVKLQTDLNRYQKYIYISNLRVDYNNMNRALKLRESIADVVDLDLTLCEIIISFCSTSVICTTLLLM